MAKPSETQYRSMGGGGGGREMMEVPVADSSVASELERQLLSGKFEYSMRITLCEESNREWNIIVISLEKT